MDNEVLMSAGRRLAVDSGVKDKAGYILVSGLYGEGLGERLPFPPSFGKNAPHHPLRGKNVAGKK